MSLNDWFTKGMDYSTYVENMTVNSAELEGVYKNLEILPNDAAYFEQLKPKTLRIITLTADWCGDAAFCVPILQRIAEIAEIDTMFLIRDENLELMDQYLTNGTARSIPIFIFIDENGEELAKWGPRSPEVQQVVENLRATLPPQDSPNFTDKQKEMFAAFKKAATTDPTLWQSVITDVRSRLKLSLNN